MMKVMIVAIAVALPSVAAADRVAVLPASGINVHPGYLEAAADVFRGHLLGTGRYDVVSVPGEAGKREVGAGEAAQMAQQAGAGLAAVVHVTRLGSTARVRLTVYNSAGAAVYRDELPAATPDDIDPVLARLAKGFVSGRPASDTADIETVTQREADPLLKRTATSTFGVKLGFVAPAAAADNDVDVVPGGSLFWLYDVRSFLAEIDFGFHTKDGFGDVWLGLGTFYPFTRENVAPYIGGGLKWIHTDYGGGGASGIQLYGAGGVLIGRLSTVQLRGELQYFMNTYDEPVIEGKTGSSRSHGLVFNVGIGI